MNSIKKILITGGPCAGKTSSINEIKKYYEKKNYNVLIVPETPTALITGGITPKEIGNMNFIKLVINVQMKLQQYYQEKANQINENKVIIIFDGCPIDCLKFISREEFDNLIKEYDLSFEKIINEYDGIIHLESVANRFPEMYSTETNKARGTDEVIAAKREDLLLKVYDKCQNRIIVHCYEEFDEKVENVINACELILNK